MTATKETSYEINISADGIWAGNGIYDHSETETHVWGNIRDCAAILGGSQEKAEEIYEAIEDAITDMDAPADGKIEVDGVTYEWTLQMRETLVCGQQVQHDRSGVGHCWVDVPAYDLPADVQMEIEGEIIDGKVESCADFMASNGQHLRW